MRLQAPFVFRLRWKAGSAAGKDAAAHAGYVATRHGVARADEEMAGQMDAVLHPQYLDERPGSTGLFGPDPQRPPVLAAVQDEVRDRPWHWQAVISLRQDDAQALGMAKPADWRDLTRRIMPRMALAAGVAEGDLRWVAAMHRKAGHPHVHVLAWVREGAPDRGPALERKELREVRRAVASEVYGPLRAELAAERTAARDALVLSGRISDAHARRLHLEAERLAPPPRDPVPVLARADLDQLVRRIQSLSSVLPGSGRLALAYMPEPVRRQARDIAAWVLDRPALSEAVARYERATRDLAGLYSARPADLDAAWERARNDVRERVAQGVLRAARDGQTPAAGSARVERRRGAASVVHTAQRVLATEARRAEVEAELAREQAQRERTDLERW